MLVALLSQVYLKPIPDNVSSTFRSDISETHPR